MAQKPPTSDMTLNQGSQTQIAPRAKWRHKLNPRAALWRDATMAVPEPYLKQLLHLRKVSWVIGKSFLAVSTLVWNELVHLLAEDFHIPVTKLNNVDDNYLKIPKNIAGLCLRPLLLTFGLYYCKSNYVYFRCAGSAWTGGRHFLWRFVGYKRQRKPHLSWKNIFISC